MKLKRSFQRAFSLLLSLTFCIGVVSAQSSYLRVYSSADSGTGSLRQAIQSASTGDFIFFAESLSGDTIFLTTGPIAVNKNLKIFGPEAGKVYISGGGNQQLLHIQTGANLLLRDMHLIQGKASGGAMGGAIYNEGDLHLQQVYFSQNTADVFSTPPFGALVSYGGAIANDGKLFAKRCVFRDNNITGASGNLSGGAIANFNYANFRYCQFDKNKVTVGSYSSGGISQGGAIFNDGKIDAYGCSFTQNEASGSSQLNSGSGIGGAIHNKSFFHVWASTFSGNSCEGEGFFGGSALGGAIFNGDSLILEQVTISGNEVEAGGRIGGATGAGILSYHFLQILNSTITDNTTFDSSPNSSVGGGIEVRGELEMGGTILANNIAFLGSNPFPAGSDANLVSMPSVVSLGYNLIGNNTSLNLPNILGNILNPLGFKLDPLADNGGPSLTHGLPSGSIALDAGDPALSLDTDQRGYPRAVNGRADIGAFEQGPCELWVKNTNDDGPGSLRHALNYAQEGCDIHINPALTGRFIILTSGEIAVSRNLTLNGLGRGKLYLRSDRTSRLLKVQASAHFNLSNITLVLGNAYEKAGGAIVNHGHLTLDRVDITNCFAFTGNAIFNSGELSLNECRLERNGVSTLIFQLIKGVEGGAIYNAGNLTAKTCVFSQNIAGVGNGGGIAKGGAIFNAGTAAIFTSTFDKNKAGGGTNGVVVAPEGYGGGIYSTGELNINACLFTNNVAKGYGETFSAKPPYIAGIGKGDGGAIFSTGDFTLQNSTISHNISNLESRTNQTNNWVTSSTGGVYADEGTIHACTFVGNTSGLAGAVTGGNKLKIGNSIFAGNSGNFNLSGGLSAGYNLIDSLKNTNWPAAISDLTGTVASPVDAMLGPLADHGGPTLTYALRTGSPAIDAGDPDNPQSYDQRGYNRPEGGRTDIGALEAYASPIIHIVDPIDGDSIISTFNLIAKAEINGLEIPYLEVICPDASHRRLRMGSGPNSIWAPRVDVTAGGNDHLVMRIRDPLGNINWQQIGLHPNGITTNAIALSSYLPTNPGTDWITISIPLADFDPRISFGSLSYIEFPSSKKAGPFELHIGEVTFTGGTTPYRWFGLDKLDNKNDGDGAQYHMNAQLKGKPVAAYVTAVQFELDGQYAGEDLLSPYSFEYGNLAPGTYSLTATAMLSDGNCFRSPPVDIVVTEPTIEIITPRDSSFFNAPADLTIRAEVEGVTGPDYLKIICPDNSFRKVGLGHNPNSIWSPNVDVTASGNNKMEITLRDPSRNANWNKMEIHPQGSIASPVVLGNYLPPLGIGENWVTISIPLSDFASSIDFSQISFLEIPYSRAAGPFEIHIQQIEFTGGSQPFLWLGEGKMDNAHNGFGKIGQLDVELIRGNGNGPVTQVDFYANGILLGTDLDAPYTYDWLQIPVGNYQLVSKAVLSNGITISSDPVYLVIQSSRREGLFTEGTFEVNAFPNPFSDQLTLRFQLDEAEELDIKLMDVSGRKLLQEWVQFSSGIQNHQLTLSALPDGVYVIAILRENGEWVKRKVVKR